MVVGWTVRFPLFEDLVWLSIQPKDREALPFLPYALRITHYALGSPFYEGHNSIGQGVGGCAEEEACEGVGYGGRVGGDPGGDGVGELWEEAGRVDWNEQVD